MDTAFSTAAGASESAPLDDLQNVAQLVLEERGLAPVVDALLILITTDDLESAL